MTGLTPARIRKWQERYRMFEPEEGKNGYWYYTNMDYIILRHIQIRIDRGEKLSRVMKEGRKGLISSFEQSRAHAVDLQMRRVKEGTFEPIANDLDIALKSKSFRGWIRKDIRPLVVQVGEAWESGYIDITEEHRFSRWMQSYLMEKIKPYEKNARPEWLVAIFPGDEHELGALMYYGILRSLNIPARFYGALPVETLMGELANNPYRHLSISMVLPQKKARVQSVKRKIRRRFPGLHINFGGYGARHIR